MGCRHRARGWGWGVFAAWMLGFGQVAAATEPMRCLSWPGEPVPLPQTNDADAVRARWAALRLGELVREAGLAEATASVESQRLWWRVLCLDPQHAGAREGIARTRPVRVHRPEVAWTRAVARPSSPWDDFDAAVLVTRRPPPPPPEPPAVKRARELVASASSSLSNARFEEALGRALAVRQQLAGEPAGAVARSLGLEAEVIAATAQVALGDEAGARESLALALALDPQLALDPSSTSPKVLSALEAARSEGGAP